MALLLLLLSILGVASTASTASPRKCFETGTPLIHNCCVTLKSTRFAKSYMAYEWTNDWIYTGLSNYTDITQHWKVQQLGQYYKFVNMRSNQCLCKYNYGGIPHAASCKCDHTDTKQDWTATDRGLNVYNLENRENSRFLDSNLLTAWVNVDAREEEKNKAMWEIQLCELQKKSGPSKVNDDSESSKIEANEAS
jgi:Ricin-type beta-trefoil lectin domain-like